jgi:hypothetical protein
MFNINYLLIHYNLIYYLFYNILIHYRLSTHPEDECSGNADVVLDM